MAAGSAVVVGASAGIGRACCQALLSRGVPVAALARNRAALHVIPASLPDNAAEPDFLPLECDATDPAAVSEAFNRIAFCLPPVETVIYTAGVALPIGPIWACDPAAGATSLDTLLAGAWITASVALRQLIHAGRGVLLIASSGAADKAALGRSAYSAGKAGVNQLVRVVGAELAAAELQVGIAAFYPGKVATAMQADLRAAANAWSASEFASGFAELLNAPESLLEPAEVAERLIELMAREPAELNGRIWALRDGQWQSR